MRFDDALRMTLEEHGKGIMRDPARFRDCLYELCDSDSPETSAFITQCDEQFLAPFNAACELRTATALSDAVELSCDIIADRHLLREDALLGMTVLMGQVIGKFLDIADEKQVAAKAAKAAEASQAASAAAAERREQEVAATQRSATPTAPAEPMPAAVPLKPVEVVPSSPDWARRVRQQRTGRPSESRQPRRVKVVPILIAVAVAGVVSGVGAWYFLSPTSPLRQRQTPVQATSATSDEESGASSSVERVTLSQDSQPVQDEASSEDQEQAATNPKLSQEGFPKNWKGTYEGHTSDVAGGVIKRSIELRFDTVGTDGKLSGRCVIGVADNSAGAGDCSYVVEGTVDWQTGEFEVAGTSWINQGDFRSMRRFSGKVDAAVETIQGTSEELSGANEGSLYLKAE